VTASPETTTAGPTRPHPFVRPVWSDVWAGLCVSGLGIVGLIGAQDIFIPRGLTDFLGPRTFPLAVSGALVLLGGALVGRALLRRRQATSENSLRLSALLVLVGSIGAFIALMEPLGFLLSAFGLLAGLFFYLGERRVWLAAGVAAAVAAAITYGFSAGLNVALPQGPFGL
jgi:putative tricarboxylic transport membrane protein